MNRHLRIHGDDYRRAWDIHTLWGMCVGIIAVLAILSQILPLGMLASDQIPPLSFQY